MTNLNQTYALRKFLLSLWRNEARFWTCILTVGFILGGIGAVADQWGLVWCGGGAFGVAVARLHDLPDTTDNEVNG